MPSASLLQDESVTAAAKAAAASYAEREAAAAPAVPANQYAAAAASAEAMRAMIDAAARNSRPGSGASAAAAAVAGSGEAAGEAGGEQVDPAAAVAEPAFASSQPVDTKSLRRLVEDMRGRGWRLHAASSGGHIRCERTFPDLPGHKQIYFLCSTPSGA